MSNEFLFYFATLMVSESSYQKTCCSLFSSHVQAINKKSKMYIFQNIVINVKQFN